MNKQTKMNYNLDVTRRIKLIDASIIGGTKDEATSLKGEWVKINPTMFAFVEDDQTTLIEKDETHIGCGCPAFTSSSVNTMCKHLVAFGDLKTTPQRSIKSDDYRWLSGYLISLGWTATDGWLYPNIDENAQMFDEEGQEAGMSNDQIDKSEMIHYECPKCGDAVDIDENKLWEWKLNHLDVCKGKPEANSPEIPNDSEANVPPSMVNETDQDDDKPKMWSLTCPHCDHVETGIFLDTVKAAIAEHVAICPENPANKPDAEVQKPEPQKEPSDKKMTPKSPKNDKPNKSASIFDDIEELIEFGVGQIFGDTGTGKTAFCRELAEQAAGAGKKVTYWDSEGNMTRKQRTLMAEHKNITYIIDRSWENIKHMLPIPGEDGKPGASKYNATPKLRKCDLFILDSIGAPVLGIFGSMNQKNRGEALLGMQGLMYRLGVWAGDNDAVVIVTNQPISEMNKTGAEKANRHPFGDKAKYFSKEILSIAKDSAACTEYKSVFRLKSWRSRDEVSGKMLATITISDKGTEIEFGG